MTELLAGIEKRWRRHGRRRRVGRAYDMALEVARIIPSHSRVLDVGCGTGFIAHHLSALLETNVVGIDLAARSEAPIEYLKYDGSKLPVLDESFDVVLLCYVLHHAGERGVLLKEVRRVLGLQGLAVVYEDIPDRWWDRFICWTHHLRWKDKTGPCEFSSEAEWRELFLRFGFQVVVERSLSRWRNLTHPVRRRFYVLQSDRALDDTSAFSEGDVLATREFANI